MTSRSRPAPRTRWRMRHLAALAVVGGALVLGGAASVSVAATATATATAQVAPSPESTPVPESTTVPVESPEPVEPTETPAPTLDPEPTVEPEPTAEPTPTAEPSVDPSPTATSTPVPAVPPAVTTSTIALPTLLVAAAVVLAGGILLWLLLRREKPSAAPAPARADAAAGASPETEPAPVVLDGMASLGTAMIDSGYPVGQVRAALDDMARVGGLTAAAAVVFPTSILVSTGDGATAHTRAVSAGDRSALLYQVDAVDRIAGVARTQSGAARWVRRQVDRVATLPPPFSRVQRVVAYALLSAALAVLLGSSWPGVALAGALGLGVGAVLLTTESAGAVYRALVVVGVSLGAGVAVLTVAHLFDPGVLPSIIAPLIMLLPGGLLTISVLELATGHIMSGAARLAAGAMRLVLLAVGIVAAAALLGVPAITYTQWPTGPVVPWIAVAVFGVGICVYQCAKPGQIGWILIVLYVAYGAQVIGDVFFDGVLSALVGAAAMTPVAVVIARQRTGPPAVVSFLPAFWLLVPGALGLIGVATVLEGDASGTSTIITTIATMVSIALGVLLGLAASGSVRGFRNASAGEWMSGDADDPQDAGDPGDAGDPEDAGGPGTPPVAAEGR